MMNRYADVPKLLECMDALLKHGADPTMKDQDGKIPAAYYTGRIDEHPLLLKLTPQPPIFVAIDKMDVSAIRDIVMSCQYKNRAVEELYLGMSPIEYTLDVIFKQKDSNATNEESSRKAAYVALVEIFKLMMKEGDENDNEDYILDFLAGGSSCQPPLFKVCAVLQEAYENEKEGEKKGVGDDQDNDGSIQLIQSLKELFRLLIPLWPNDDDRLIHLFHLACLKNNLDMVQLYLDEDCSDIDPNAIGSKMGMTALHFACRSGSTSVVQFLLTKENIDPTIVDVRGKSPLDTAKLNEYDELASMLETFLASGSQT